VDADVGVRRHGVALDEQGGLVDADLRGHQAAAVSSISMRIVSPVCASHAA
jgi:hypothetical protein